MNDFSPGAAPRRVRDQGAASVPAPDFRPVDPADILTSLGFLAYGWDLRSGSLSFVGEMSKVLPGDWGHGFATVADLESSQVSPVADARRAALFGEERLDDGSGVPYGLAYRLRSRDGCLFAVEESGRWFAGLPGEPLTARGLLRVRPPPAELREDGGKALEDADRVLGPSDLRGVLERSAAQAQRTRRNFAVIAVAVGRSGPAGSGRASAPDAGEGIAARLRRVMRRGDMLVRIDERTSLCVLNACDETQMATAVKRLESAFDRTTEDEDGLAPTGKVAGAIWKGSHANAEALAHSVIDRARAGTAASGEAQSRPEPQAIDWHQEILQALNERRFALACQPVVNAVSRTVAFHEGLLRLRDRSGRLVPASVFIPTSEETGLVSLLDRRVIELASAALAGQPDLKLAINASALSLFDPEWLAALRSRAAGPVPFAGRLILEITESAALADVRRAAEVLTAVKELGVAVALDDFGAGHTSFRTLRLLPLDIIKIDGAFVQDVDRSSDGRFFIRTLLDLARHIGCKVVAEWVENESSARIVEGIGVDYLQGRLFGAPRLPDQEPAPQAMAPLLRARA